MKRLASILIIAIGMFAAAPASASNTTVTYNHVTHLHLTHLNDYGYDDGVVAACLRFTFSRDDGLDPAEQFAFTFQTVDKRHRPFGIANTTNHTLHQRLLCLNRSEYPNEVAALLDGTENILLAMNLPGTTVVIDRFEVIYELVVS